MGSLIDGLPQRVTQLERDLAATLRDLDARVDALEARQVATEAPPPLPALPVRYLAGLEGVALVLAVADALGLPRVTAWAYRVARVLMERGGRVAARRGMPAQVAPAAHVVAKEQR